MRPWRAQGDHGLPLSARMIESEARIAEGDLALFPGDMACKLAVADSGHGGRLLAHPGEQRGDRVRLGRQLSLPGDGGLGDEAAIEAGSDCLGFERNEKARGPLDRKSTRLNSSH